MKTSHFSFELPEELIAQYPSDSRGESRLMMLNRETGAINHHSINELPSLLPEGSLMVFNNSRVRKARIYGESSTGGKVEFLLIKALPEENTEGKTWLAMVSKAKKQKPGKRFRFAGGLEGEIIRIEGSHRVLGFSETVDDEWLDIHGRMPLPPYIKREDEFSDAERYQTVYSEKTGSIAAPTAGLHFTDKIMSDIASHGIETAFISLHVGLGTFLPVRTEDISDHKMHCEDYEISAAAADAINKAASEKRSIVAVGTTSVRTLESEAARLGRAGVESGRRSTDIFIYPGREFSIVNHMVTNFHTPESSLLMLVSAFAGKKNIDKAYQTAIDNKYRFYSYGDAMFII
ncbi:MAG: tRNA preQ1(34) S-adenosylmethionine ribosyltransferase-isomerase QueA [Spirochaetales bacterium]|uniref:S-adenosylmethionine:tRNA ribosyltransferase-isomerase n=1 Tax=Candidatus Thalassospirochaeta sargassi TaxID=3119039 RepID=A0AAJ1IB15_9SPIO|nr:tRNA preQ1(34) S-adenosylmethionine ribosyltransferase-isomerase QueA [Spirochaetales bacterium]